MENASRMKTMKLLMPTALSSWMASALNAQKDFTLAIPANVKSSTPTVNPSMKLLVSVLNATLVSA